MLKAGITGGIGSGKTTVCRIFEILHVPVYYADDRAKILMHTNQELRKKISAAFGEQAYKNDILNREYLAETVFNDAGKLSQLNALVHPVVIQDASEWANKYPNKPYTLKEAALLFESGSYRQLDKIIVVTAPKEMRISRIMQRDNVTRGQVLARMDNQMPEEEKVKRADFIIRNDDKHLLVPQVIEIHKALG